MLQVQHSLAGMRSRHLFCSGSVSGLTCGPASLRMVPSICALLRTHASAGRAFCGIGQAHRREALERRRPLRASVVEDGGGAGRVRASVQLRIHLMSHRQAGACGRMKA